MKNISKDFPRSDDMLFFEGHKDEDSWKMNMIQL